MINRYLGIDSDFIIIGLVAVALILIILVVVIMVKMKNLRKRYEFFMTGETAKNLEDTLIYRLDQVDELIEANMANERNIDLLFSKMTKTFCKMGLVKYNALDELGGKLSFSLAMLDELNNGYIINAVHSREGCYTYLKEIIDGNSVINLAEEEKQALDSAISGEK